MVPGGAAGRWTSCDLRDHAPAERDSHQLRRRCGVDGHETPQGRAVLGESDPRRWPLHTYGPGFSERRHLSRRCLQRRVSDVRRQWRLLHRWQDGVAVAHRCRVLRRVQGRLCHHRAMGHRRHHELRCLVRSPEPGSARQWWSHRTVREHRESQVVGRHPRRRTLRLAVRHRGHVRRRAGVRGWTWTRHGGSGERPREGGRRPGHGVGHQHGLGQLLHLPTRYHLRLGDRRQRDRTATGDDGDARPLLRSLVGGADFITMSARA